mgnify:CR=1 FL=1
MLTHLIILLDDTSVSYCHYNVPQAEHKLIKLDDLKAGIVWGMKENVNIQFIYPNYELPAEYNDVIESIDHTKIKPVEQAIDADVVVMTGWETSVLDVYEDATIIIRATRKELSAYLTKVNELLKKATRLNVVVTDVENFTDADIDAYKLLLEELSVLVDEQLKSGRTIQLNLLTDRLMLDEMNNCNAGVNNITLAPNGRFYLCPAFYYDEPKACMGDMQRGLHINNQQLLQLDHAPICRHCDAWQCRRCVWLNERLTLDRNTPSHQQCVMAHLERNASRDLLVRWEQEGFPFGSTHRIEEITELDPFNTYKQWK